MDFTEDELIAAFKRLDIDRDSCVTFTELKKLFTAATGGSFRSEKNQSNSNISNNIRNQISNDLFSSYRNDSPNRLPSSNPTRKTPLRSEMRSSSRTRKSEMITSREKSPVSFFKESANNIVINRSIERLNRCSIKGNEIDLAKSTNKDFFKDEGKYDKKNNNLLLSFKSTNFNSTGNTFNNLTNLNKLSGGLAKEDFYNSNMISYEEENFNSYLNQLIQYENEIESTKFNLIIKADFNVEDAFRIFELSGRGYLTELDIKYGMNSLDIYPSQEEINLLVKRYDLTKEGILVYKFSLI